MRNLLNFLARYNNLILFLLLEGIAIYLIATRNNYHNTAITKGVRGITMIAEREISDAAGYFRLRSINENLSEENSLLRNQVEMLRKKDTSSFISITDTLLDNRYEYTSAEIVNNSVSRQKNFFTLDKGRKQGLQVDMAVIGPEGAAGIIVAVSDNFSIAMSLLNLDFRLSSRIRSNGYFGSLTWDGRDYRYAVLNEIPQHVALHEGDTIETTSYSAIFPAGIMVGTISSFESSGSDFYRIRVRLSTDFKKLSHVNAIRNLRRDEQLKLEIPVQ
jgi:rod shape-determining protein MreC